MDANKELEQAVNELRREELIELIEELRQVAGAHRVQVGPNDVIVLRHPGFLSDEAHHRLSTLIPEGLPDYQQKLMILEEGMSITVLGFDEEGE